ncbi:E3 ubiquitin-protein ligase TRIM39-like [Pleurodeles waltl]|uniref:E3 ubiquitin-protein ligase TRIM39-like n=1 Tax=Pleurodeles waltl TaxID=8319 RepID=UPI0037093F63
MATASQLQELKDEVTCPICFEYFKEPVIAECGHNFCKSCITYCLEALNAKMPCPLCQRPLREGKLQPNRQVSNMIPVVQQMILKRKKREEEHLCEKHDEKLCLFCHEDQETICVACSQSAEHTDHNVVTIERAAQEYKMKFPMKSKKTLQSSIEKLKLELENQKTLCAKKEQDVVKMEVRNV